jgi:DNA-binding CsgD family transcriptional regulator
MNSSVLGGAARLLIERLFDIASIRDERTAVTMAYEDISRLLPFSTAIYVPISAAGWTLSASDQVLVHPRPDEVCGETHWHLDPWVRYLACLRAPNRALRLADAAPAASLRGWEGSAVLREVSFFRALGCTPFVRGLPIGVFSIARCRAEADFDESERRDFEWLAMQLARGLDYRRSVLHCTRGSAEAGAIVLAANARPLSINDEARRLLHELPRERTFAVPAAFGRARVWLCGRRAIAVHRAYLPAGSLLALLGADHAPPAELDASFDRILLPGPGERPSVVCLEPLEHASRVGARLAGHGFSPRQEQIAALLLGGYSAREIAAACGIAAVTAKEYVTAVYRKVGARDRAEFVSFMAGGCDPAEIPVPAPPPTCG